jgi:hypothetical protein
VEEETGADPFVKGVALSQETNTYLGTDQYRAMQARGCTALRIEATPGLNDGYITYMRKNEPMKMVLLCGMALTPQISPAQWTTATVPAAHIQTWLTAFENALARIGGGDVIDYVEIWNEPNSNPGETGLHPLVYGTLLEGALNVLARVSPQSRVITGGLFAHVTSGGAYLTEAISHVAGFTKRVQCIGWHPYLDQAGGLQAEHFTAMLADLETRFKLPVFITEAGWDTSKVSLELQASNLELLFKLARASGKVEGCLVFTLLDAANAAPPLHFGIMYKPAFEAFRSA